MSNTYLIQDHCFKIEENELRIYVKGESNYTSINLLNNLTTIEISQDGTEASILTDGSFLYRHDFNLGLSEFWMDSPSGDNKPIAMIIGEINIEYPGQINEETYFEIAKAGDTFGLMISEVQGTHVLQVHRNRTEIKCGYIEKPDCYI